MTPVIPPQGFRHAVDLLLKNSVRKFQVDAEQLARDLVALGDDMKASPDVAAWVIAEYERVLQRPAPAVLARLGHNAPRDPERRDLFLIYVPEDRLPVAAPVAVELAKRGISVAFAEYEVDSEDRLAWAVARGLDLNRAGAVLRTPDFLRRNLPDPAPNPRLNILGQIILPAAQAEALALWLSHIHTTKGDFRG
jgi:hypothetical protein